MKYKIFEIAGGNSTALVQGVTKKQQLMVSKVLLREVEQVGFVDVRNKSLGMMGGELCINATIAAAKFFGRSGVIKLDNAYVNYKNTGESTVIDIELNYKIEGNILIFDGIGYIFSKETTVEELAKLANKYKLPAFGSVSVVKGCIFPTVYVKAVNSCTDETSCGSASIAQHLLTGKKDISQPSGGTICVDINRNKFRVIARVEEIK